MVNQLSAAAATTGTNTTTTGTSASAQAAAAIMKFSGFSSNVPRAGTPNPNERSGEETVKEEDGLLSLDTAEQMLKWHAEAIGRCVVLSPSGDV